ncbi:hypothetical protein PanWU01x14_131140 [Parasponia andersonii]|uniref:RNase H type-1 domain-containing protein n=1 Tax=Parasponia andersonii TaxID=3476 RepID=A0A2P5CQW8_PARAD|nr:hypothetical protein PanWU01x14_131140 [Parasponia andersonii]
MNVDASLLSNSHRMGMGAIIRDYTGQAIAALSKKLSGITLLKTWRQKLYAFFNGLKTWIYLF